MKTMRIACMAAVAMLTGTAEAAVTYTFVGTNAGSGAGAGPTGSFTYTVDNFITADRTVPAGGLDSCTVVTPAGSSCGLVRFYLDSPIDGSAQDVVEFLDTQTAGYRFAFADGAFFYLGSYASLTGSGGGIGTLTISDAAAAVPEPATWAMLIAGFGTIGATARRRRAATLAAA